MIQSQNPEISHWPVMCPGNMYKLYTDGYKTTVAVLCRYERSYKLLPSSSLPYLFVIEHLMPSLFFFHALFSFDCTIHYIQIQTSAVFSWYLFRYRFRFLWQSSSYMPITEERGTCRTRLLYNIRLAVCMTRSMTYHCNGNYIFKPL